MGSRRPQPTTFSPDPVREADALSGDAVTKAGGHGLRPDASTFVTEIHDVPDAGEPHRMEIMSIAFDKHNQLFGTGLTVYFDHPEGSPVLAIDTSTGETDLLGYSQTVLANHGGDIMPNRVKVAHRRNNGEFECQWVNMRALPAHLAHGDYVPGSAGHDCDCP